MPNHFDIYKAFITNFKKLGVDIELFYLTDTGFKYNNTNQRIKNFFRKLFLNDTNYKQKLKDNYDSLRLENKLEKLNKKVDYTLIIRPDFLSVEIIKKLRNYSKFIIAYQWDGIERYPNAKELLPLFDHFFLFDKDDYKKYKPVYPNISFTTNFYFEIEKPKSVLNKKKKVFFIGSFIENRMGEILYFANICKDLSLELDINILYFENSTPSKYKNCGINFISKNINYLDVVEKVSQADIILDFIDNVHNGLSFRIFEAMYYSKKLITTNQTVGEYDFYDKDNILIWTKEIDKELITQFISSEYKHLDKNIIDKYSFKNWIKNILNADGR